MFLFFLFFFLFSLLQHPLPLASQLLSNNVAVHVRVFLFQYSRPVGLDGFEGAEGGWGRVGRGGERGGG